ncbi:MAG: PspC domain-containing protein [Patescibacteria group bacterium]
MGVIVSFILLLSGLVGFAIIAKTVGLKRDPDKMLIAGVCAGIAKKFGVKPVVVRLAFVLSVLLVGFGILPYVILWIILEKEK